MVLTMLDRDDIRYEQGQIGFNVSSRLPEGVELEDIKVTPNGIKLKLEVDIQQLLDR